LSATAPVGKIRNNSMSIGVHDDASQVREVEELGTAVWVSTELREVRERGSRVDGAKRA
jgi:hypothetical protein